MFQIQNSPADPSPWLLYPASNKTVWIVTIKLGKQLLSQIVNFTIVSSTSEVSTPVANLTNTVPTDIVYDSNQSRVWIVENDNLAYYNQTTTSRITTAQTFPNSAPQYLAIDSQHNLWLTLLNTDQIVEYVPYNGASYYYSTPSSNAGLQGIGVSPEDGSVWFAEAYSGRIGHLIPCNTSSCAITEYSPPSGMSIQGVIQVAVDKSGVVWFTVHDGNEFGSFNPSTGEWKLFPLGYCSDDYVQGCEAGLPNAITVDSTGQVWLSEHYSGRIGRYNPSSGTLIEYMMPTTSAVCSRACTPFSWWMWPGQNNLVWFVAFGLGEIGYVNATVPVHFTIASPASITVAQGSATSLPISVTYLGGFPHVNASATSQDTSSNPPMLSWSVKPQLSSSRDGMESATVTVSAAWSSSLGPRYIAVSAYNENVTVNGFVRIDVVASLSAYTTIGFAGGISTFSAAATGLAWYRKKKHSNGTTARPSSNETTEKSKAEPRRVGLVSGLPQETQEEVYFVGKSELPLPT